MNKRQMALLFFIGFFLMGCSSNGMTGSKPPNTLIKIENETYQTTLGAYCWGNSGQSTCVDTLGPIELLEDKDPIPVKRGEVVTIVMDYEPKPNEYYVYQINENEETEVVMENNHFTAPKEKGMYYYSYSVWWNSEKEANVSNGDAFYAFALKVF